MKPIKVWRYADAPKLLQFSTNGGDEDWLALIPPAYEIDYVSWLEVPAFGCCDVDSFKIATDGSVLKWACEHEDGHAHTRRLVEKPHPRRALLYAGYEVRIGCHA